MKFRAEVAPNAPRLSSLNIPAPIVVLPAYVLAPLNARIPVPVLVRLPLRITEVTLRSTAALVLSLGENVRSAPPRSITETLITPP